MTKARFRDFPPIPWVSWLSARKDRDGHIYYWQAAANWRQYGVTGGGRTRYMAIGRALAGVIRFGVTGRYHP